MGIFLIFSIFFNFYVNFPLHYDQPTPKVIISTKSEDLQYMRMLFKNFLTKIFFENTVFISL